MILFPPFTFKNYNYLIFPSKFIKKICINRKFTFLHMKISRLYTSIIKFDKFSLIIKFDLKVITKDVLCVKSNSKTK